MRASILPGVRVVRGPDWIWQNQDDGEGHVGTVCEVGRSGSTNSPENTVVVNWDCGHRTNYRVGYQNKYDLIIIDNAQVGVRHSNVVCDGCCKGGIAGIVFKCAECPNYHLCIQCYGSDLHDIEHSFIRYSMPTTIGVVVPPRKYSTKIPLMGIYVGAKVVRGSDWEWGQQDGGEGKTGRVMEIRGWDNESCRSVANVSWLSGSTNVYRLGHKGNIDLKYLVPTQGGFYYKEHMPILGLPEKLQPVIATVKPKFAVGDRVKVCIDIDALMKLQQGHGGWNPRMIEHLPNPGTVHRITEKGDIRVQYDNCPNRWTFHPAALVKVVYFRLGDLVTIISDAHKVQQLQKGHGEWIELMRYSLGKHCKVIKVYSDGDLRIQQLDDGFEWTLNPKCVKLDRSQLATAAERSNSMMDLSHRRIDHIMTPLSGLCGTSVADKLVREAAQGHLEFVKNHLEINSTQVDVTSGGKACIHVASHQGHVELVKYLLSKGANVNIVDKEGDSALHYAAFGNQPETMRVLLQNGADINFLNSSHCSALHICAHKKIPHCIRELLFFGADINIQDSYGDTALHDAIGKENTDVVQLLCNAPNLDFTVRNNRGFNVLHHASLKGNVVATKNILHLSRQLVNVKKDDGFAPLHLAALNGHVNVVEILILEGKAETDIRNNRQQTPFLLAVAQGHSAVIEKLVTFGCDIEAKDEDGDNAIHLCFIKKSNFQHIDDLTNSSEINEIYKSLSYITKDRLMYSIICYLAMKGCKIYQNNKGADIFEWITDKKLRQTILSYQNVSSIDQELQIVQIPNNLDQITSSIEDLNIDGIVTATLQTEIPSITRESVRPSHIHKEQISRRPQVICEDVTRPTEKNIQSVNQNMKTIQSKKNYIKENISSKNVLDYMPMSNEVDGATSLYSTSFQYTALLKKCIVCDEILSLIKFEPCQHQISCEGCGIRMKKCLQCGVLIENRITETGSILNIIDQNRVHSADRLRYLENKIQEYEETHYCSICMERTRDVAFLCGHGACSVCADTLRTCHMCRKTILKKINLY